MSKGDWRRPRGEHVSEDDYGQNFEAIFGKKELKTWEPGRDEGTRIQWFDPPYRRKKTNEQTKCVQDQPESTGGNPGPAESAIPYSGDSDGEDIQASSDTSPGPGSGGGQP